MMNKIATQTATQAMSDINDISSYDYFLPNELIAKSQFCQKKRQDCLFILKKTKEIKHFKFKDLASLIPEDAAVIF